MNGASPSSNNFSGFFTTRGKQSWQFLVVWGFPAFGPIGNRGDTFCGHLLFQPAATSAASAAMRHSGAHYWSTNQLWCGDNCVIFLLPIFIYIYIKRGKERPMDLFRNGCVWNEAYTYIIYIYIYINNIYIYSYIYMLKFYVNALTTLTNQLISGKHASGRSLGTLVPFGKQTCVVNHPSPLSGYGSKVDTPPLWIKTDYIAILRLTSNSVAFNIDFFRSSVQEIKNAMKSRIPHARSDMNLDTPCRWTSGNRPFHLFFGCLSGGDQGTLVITADVM